MGFIDRNLSAFCRRITKCCSILVFRPSTVSFKFARGKLTRYEKMAVHRLWFIYDEAEGLEEEGIAPGTRWDEIPDDWVCPECGVGKADFEMMEID